MTWVFISRGMEHEHADILWTEVNTSAIEAALYFRRAEWNTLVPIPAAVSIEGRRFWQFFLWTGYLVGLAVVFNWPPLECFPESWVKANGLNNEQYLLFLNLFNAVVNAVPRQHACMSQGSHVKQSTFCWSRRYLYLQWSICWKTSTLFSSTQHFSGIFFSHQNRIRCTLTQFECT